MKPFGATDMVVGWLVEYRHLSSWRIWQKSVYATSILFIAPSRFCGGKLWGATASPTSLQNIQQAPQTNALTDDLVPSSPLNCLPFTCEQFDHFLPIQHPNEGLALLMPAVFLDGVATSTFRTMSQSPLKSQKIRCKYGVRQWGDQDR